MKCFRPFFLKIIKLILILFIIELPVLYFNTIIDPFGIFRKDFSNQRIEPNKRFIKMRYLTNNVGELDCDSYIFGSSRVNFLQANIPDGNYYNMHYSEGLPAEHFNDLKMMIEKDIEIKNIIICLDELSYMVDPERHIKESLRKPFPESFIFQFLTYMDYVFMPPKLSFVKSVLDTKKGDCYRELRETGRTILSQLDEEINTNISLHINMGKFRKPYYQSYYENRINETITVIKNIVELAKKNDIGVTFLVNPIHHATYLNLDLDIYYEFLRQLSKITPFYDFSGLNSVTLDNYFYYETSHYRSMVGDMMISRIFNNGIVDLPMDFGKFINENNIEEHIESQYQKVESFSWNSQKLLEKAKMNATTIFSIDRISNIGKRKFDSIIPINSNYLIIKGWAADEQNNCQAGGIYLDFGGELFFGDYGSRRKAVAKRLKNPQYEKTGFSFTIPCYLLPGGKSKANLFVLSKDENSYYEKKDVFQIDVRTNKPPLYLEGMRKIPRNAQFSIDNINDVRPNRNKKPIDISGSFIFVNGWAIDKINKKRNGGVYCVIDDTLLFPAYCKPRKDVADYYKNPNYLNSGFQSIIPGVKLSDGNHFLKLIVLTRNEKAYYESKDKYNFVYHYKDPETYDDYSKINGTTHYKIEKINEKNIVNDTITISGNEIEISGWALDKLYSRIPKEICFELDGKRFATKCFIARPDIVDRYINPDYENCGFKLVLPITKCENTVHVLSLKILAASGDKYYQGDDLILIKDITTN